MSTWLSKGSVSKIIQYIPQRRIFLKSFAEKKKVRVLSNITLHFAYYAFLTLICKVKVNQSHYRPEVPRGFQEVKVPRLRDNGPGCW